MQKTRRLLAAVTALVITAASSPLAYAQAQPTGSGLSIAPTITE